jgi:hypothetical protein
MGAVLIIASCNGGGGGDDDTTRFSVRVENIGTPMDFLDSGVFNTPDGAGSPGPATNGNSYSFTVAGGPGMYLSFATMYGQSNDLFFGPDGMGIDLHPGGAPLDGDVTDQVYLWDAGTEENQEPGVGDNQAPRQAAPDTGPADPDDTVRKVNDGFSYSAVDVLINVSVSHLGGNEFEVTLSCTSDDTPISPGVYVVHGNPDPLFEEGQPDYGMGLERIAEDGNPGNLGPAVAAMTGLATPLSPVAWVVHTGGAPLFTSGAPDYGDGLERIAEDGDVSVLGASLAAGSFIGSGTIAIPDGASGPGPITPGNSYTFVIEGSPGDSLSFASMFGQSNDIFLAPGQAGIDLFPGGVALSGDVSSQLSWWDCGSEANQFPGAGPDQAPRQGAPDTGAADPDTAVRIPNDGYSYTPANQLARVTITPIS